MHPTNIRLGIAAAIFVNIGTVLLYFANLFFAQRIIRAQHPRFGWSKAFAPVVPVLLVILVLAVIMVIVVSIQSFYTLNPNTRRIDHDIQLYVSTAFAVISFIPFLMVFISTCVRQIPGINAHAIDKFGAGSMRSKICLLCSMSLLLATADSIKAGAAYLPEVPQFVAGIETQVAEPVPWYDSKGVFYGLGLAPEIIVLYVYAVFYVNLRFVVPDGADRPFSYAGGFTFAGEAGNEKTGFGNHDSTKHLAGSVPSSIRSFGRPESSSRRSVVSWSGMSRERSIGDDEIERVSHTGFGGGEDFAPPPVDNEVQQELGYNPRTGCWELRDLPESTLGLEVPAPVRNRVDQDGV